MFWTKVLVERVPVALGTSLLFLVVTHPAWMPRAILVIWAVTLVVTLAEHRAYRAHQEFHRQEAAEAERQAAEMKRLSLEVQEKAQEVQAKAEAHRAELRAEAMEDLAALPRAEWMRLALFLPPDTQQAVILRRAERESEERDRVDPPWTPKAAPPEHPHGPGCRCSAAHRPEDGVVAMPGLQVLPRVERPGRPDRKA